MQKFLPWVCLGIGALLLLVLMQLSVYGRPVSPWTPERIAKEADSLIVGEVLDVKTVGSFVKEHTRSKMRILRKKARLRVLRFFSPSESRDGADAISIEFSAAGQALGTTGYAFPSISMRDVTVFPLRKTVRGGSTQWELIDEEDFALLVPALREQPSTRAASGVEFLYAELAGVFSRGSYTDIFRAARYLANMGYDRSKTVAALRQLLGNQIKDDEERWLSIAVACYCAGGIPRPKISELETAQETRRAELALAAAASDNVRSEGLIDRFLTKSLENIHLHTWGTGVTISLNGPRNPTTVKLLNQALQKGSREALYVAGYIIKDNSHPVLPAALAAARKELLSKHKWEDFTYLRAACELIRDYGSEDDFQPLLDEFRKAQEGDRERYTMLWQACAYAKTERLIPIIRIVIDDREPFANTRFCDVAAFELQRITGVDFGLVANQSVEERDKAIAKAREWLEKTAPSRELLDSQEYGTWTYLVLGVIVLGLILVGIRFLFRRGRRGGELG